MDNEFKELQKEWGTAKSKNQSSSNGLDEIYKNIKRKEIETYKFYYGTISILFTTLLGISLFFYFVAPVKEILSRIGVGLMLSSLLFRICVEIISIGKAKKINRIDSTLETVDNRIEFRKFRKKIHSIIAPLVLALYTIGFYAITPEFSLYMDFWFLVMMDVSYVIIAIVLFKVINKGIKNEIQNLEEIITLRKEIQE